jgi:hypothetical protein
VRVGQIGCHAVTKHRNLSGYPGPADIKHYRLEKQDMYWEREIKADLNGKSKLFTVLHSQIYIL